MCRNTENALLEGPCRVLATSPHPIPPEPSGLADPDPVDVAESLYRSSRQELQRAAREGPVIVVTISTIRSDALILTNDALHVVSVAGLAPETVAQHALDMTLALDTIHRSEQPDEGERRLALLLDWLGDSLVSPVLQALDWLDELDADTRPGAAPPRLTWCLSGLLGLLPVQAARLRIGTGETDRVPALKRACFAFSPNLRGLLHARRPSVGQKANSDHPRSLRVLAVAMPSTPEAPDLDGANREVELLHDLFGDGILILRGPHASRNEVLDTLPDIHWAHFACHAISDVGSSTESALLLDDHLRQPLTIADVLALDLPHADFAYLSACVTAHIGVASADECIHLASAFQVAGFRHIIGTLWSIDDDSAVTVAQDVYQRLQGGGPAVAIEALRSACLRAYEHAPEKISTWAAFVYFGG